MVDRMNDTHVELYIAPLLVRVAEDDRGAGGAPSLVKEWSRPDASGMAGRVFRRWTQRVAVRGGFRYDVTAEVRNNKFFPLTPDIRGWLEVVWLDASGREVARRGREMFTGDLSSRSWRRITLAGEEAGDEAVEAVISVVLVPRAERGEGSIWLRGMAVRPARALAGDQVSSRVHEPRPVEAAGLQEVAG